MSKKSCTAKQLALRRHAEPDPASRQSNCYCFSSCLGKKIKGYRLFSLSNSEARTLALGRLALKTGTDGERG